MFKDFFLIFAIFLTIKKYNKIVQTHYNPFNFFFIIIFGKEFHFFFFHNHFSHFRDDYNDNNN